MLSGEKWEEDGVKAQKIRRKKYATKNLVRSSLNMTHCQCNQQNYCEDGIAMSMVYYALEYSL